LNYELPLLLLLVVLLLSAYCCRHLRVTSNDTESQHLSSSSIIQDGLTAILFHYHPSDLTVAAEFTDLNQYSDRKTCLNHRRNPYVYL
jgi:hypothetical protein